MQVNLGAILGPSFPVSITSPGAPGCPWAKGITYASVTSNACIFNAGVHTSNNAALLTSPESHSVLLISCSFKDEKDARARVTLSSETGKNNLGYTEVSE